MNLLIEPGYEEIKQIPIGQWTTVVLNGIDIPHIRGRDCLIWLRPQPAYSNRGRYLAGIDILNEEKLHVDWADGWQGRYYFDLDRAKAELEAWLDCRQQLEPIELPDEAPEESDGHVHRVMQVVINPKPGAPTAWLDGEPIYASRKDDLT